nr:hypothetical protein [Candidatus Aenigmarchaeota archaeon]
EFKKGNTFGMTAFSSYGLFWLSLVALKVFPALGWAESVDLRSMGAYLTMWGIFTTWMFLSTLKTNRALQFVFLSLAILFFLLALGDFLDAPQITRFAGLEGIVCGFSAIYLAMAEVMNESYGKIILPIFPVKK